MARALFARARTKLREPVDIASLAAFRVLFGALMSLSALRVWAKGWVGLFWVEPQFHFTYPPLSFVKPWPQPGMYLHQAGIALSAIGIAVGFRYRWSALVFFLAFTYQELLERAVYLNHYYLVSLLSALLFLLPLGSAYSLDARANPGQRIASLPGWVLWALRFQVGVVYVFAGIAKLNSDWLLEAQPLRIWLAARADLPLIGAFLEEPWLAYAASWSGALFDLTIVGFLLWPRTRAIAFCVLVAFHLATGLLFPIGILPWLMIASATVFLSPDWPRTFTRFAARSTARFAKRALATFRASLPSGPSMQSLGGTWLPPRWLAPLLALHCLVQLLLPLRQFQSSDPSAWNLRGFDFSWNVMVAEKSGQVSFRARDRQTGDVIQVEPSGFLSPFQEAAMARDPELVRQAALFVARRFQRESRDVAVYADAVASLNGRPSQRMIDPNVDLTRPLPDGWIVPLADGRR